MTRAVVLVAVLLLVGCGGDDGSSGEDGIADKQPTKKEYLARGDAVCADAQAELARLQPRIQRARSAKSTEERLRLGAAIWRDQLAITERFAADLRELGAPPGDRERVEEFIRALDEGANLGREVLQHLEDGEEPPQALVEDYAQTAHRGNALARGYGFTVCGREGG